MDRTIAHAAVFNGLKPKELKICEFEIPDPAPKGELLLKTEAAGICGSDVHSFALGHAHGEVIPGHEFVGKVVRVGREIQDAQGEKIKVGDRLVPESTIPCGICSFCRGEHTHFDKWNDYAACDNYQLFGAIPIGDPPRLSGGYGEYVQIPRGAILHKMPTSLDVTEAVLLEPLAVAVRAVWKAGIRLGDVVVILGPGPIGLLCMVAAKSAGATKVILTGSKGDHTRLRIGKRLGSDRVIDVAQEDARKAINEFTDGKMADRVIDATGSPKAFWEGVTLTGKGGVYMNIGGFHETTHVSIYPDYLKRSKIDVRFSHTGANAYQAALKIIQARQFPLTEIVSHRIHLNEAEKGLVSLMERKGGEVKVLIDYSKQPVIIHK